MDFEVFAADNLQKIRLGAKRPETPAYQSDRCMENEVFSYQLVHTARLDMGTPKAAMRLEVEGALAPYVTVYEVEHVPSALPAYPDHDLNYIADQPGLFPDPLFPLEDNSFFTQRSYYRSLWVEVKPDERPLPPGKHVISIRFIEEKTGETAARNDFALEVLPISLPEQTLIHTEWLHCDCIANYYGVEVFSEPFWDNTRRFVRTAVAHGINMILTPVLTPPLDTQIGGERRTVQLVDISRKGETYSFDFSKLSRWIEMCREEGVRYFEISHLFTQWGAEHAPKVMVRLEDGTLTRLFGWETDALSPEYVEFLRQFLAALTGYLEERGLREQVFFHVSDEPEMQHLESYRRAHEIAERFLSGYPIIDALSDFEFYRRGILDRPIPATNHIDPFLESGVPGLWTYYCCGQGVDVSNRFFAMPSARCRVIGMQMFRHNIKGFLHWGYNFYNTMYSRKAIDPYAVTDGQMAFPSGDTFLVYPGEGGEPVASIRLKVFQQALQDYRAFQLAERCCPREELNRMLDEAFGEPLTFRVCPSGAEELLSLRGKLYDMLAAGLA